MMRTVVESGTGTAVQLPGIEVAGKTGTAEIGDVGANLTQPSFIAFAPADDPRDRDRGHGGALPGRLRRYRCRADRARASSNRLLN